MDVDGIRRLVDCQLPPPSRHAEDAGLARGQSLARNEAGFACLRRDACRPGCQRLGTGRFTAPAAPRDSLASFIQLLRLLPVQQVTLNSLVHNRMLLLVKNEWVAASLTGAIFAICHWPNPVLVPLTFLGGAAMAWMFGRVRNIIPLAIGQALLGLLLSWAFPVAWHHQMRVGPGYYNALK